MKAIVSLAPGAAMSAPIALAAQVAHEVLLDPIHHPAKPNSLNRLRSVTDKARLLSSNSCHWTEE